MRTHLAEHILQNSCRDWNVSVVESVLNKILVRGYRPSTILRRSLRQGGFPITTSSWRLGVVVIITEQRHSAKPELRLCAGSNSARGRSEIFDGEDL